MRITGPDSSRYAGEICAVRLMRDRFLSTMLALPPLFHPSLALHGQSYHQLKAKVPNLEVALSRRTLRKSETVGPPYTY